MKKNCIIKTLMFDILSLMTLTGISTLIVMIAGLMVYDIGYLLYSYFDLSILNYGEVIIYEKYLLTGLLLLVILMLLFLIGLIFKGIYEYIIRLKNRCRNNF